MPTSFTGRSVELSRGSTRFLLVHRFELAAASKDDRTNALEPRSGRWAVDGPLSGHRCASALAQAYHRLLGGPLRPHSADYVRRMRDAVLDAVERGVLVVLRCPPARVIMLIERHEEVLGPSEEPQSWIEIELVDDTGVAVPDEPYEIVTGNGRVRSGTLDARGRAREDGIDSGPCKVTFPRLHEWKAA
jgi:hypothetical protein